MRAALVGAGVAAIAVAAGCGAHRDAAPPPPARVESIDDSNVGPGFERFAYTGRWEHIADRRDGRSAGTSSRSPYAGDSVAIVFRAIRFRVYGVTGPNGGRALLDVDTSDRSIPLDFYSAHKRTHALIYASPKLPLAVHAITITVAPRVEKPARAYVNVDGAEVERR